MKTKTAKLIAAQERRQLREGNVIDRQAWLDSLVLDRDVSDVVFRACYLAARKSTDDAKLLQFMLALKDSKTKCKEANSLIRFSTLRSLPISSALPALRLE